MRRVALLALVILFPALAHAAVVITEIMYDVPTSVGADGTREWVEIKNTGTSSVDLTGWKFNDGSSHVLNVPPTNGSTGSLILAAGGITILVDNAVVFLGNLYPSFSGTVIDTTMSLNNTNGTIALIDQNGATEYTASYTKDMEAAGDGNTLQWNGSTFVASTPTPGTYSSGSGNTSDSGDTSDVATTTPPASSDSSGSGTYTPPPSSIAVKISSAQKVFMEVPMTLSARATTKNGAVDSGAQISWSFGDGSSAAGIEVTKTYHYAGTYVVTVTANNGIAKARDEMIVSVAPSQVHILSASSEGIMITNDSDERLDLSQWRLSSSMGSFRIPEGTTILSEASVLFPSAITNLPIAFDATLSYPDGVVAARFVPTVPVSQPSATSESSNQVQTVEQIINPKTSVELYENKAVIALAATPDTGVAARAAIPVPTAPPTLLAAAVTAQEAPKTVAGGLFHSVWTLGLLGIMALAGGAFILL